MNQSISAINSAITPDSFDKTTTDKISQSAEFFPLYMAQLSNNNINGLFSMASDSNDDEDSTSSLSFALPGSSGSYGSDPLMSLGDFTGSVSSDPLSSLIGSQGMGSDFSFMNPTASLESVKVQETLQELMAYSNITENKKWLGQQVTYVDPTDQVTKVGVVQQIDIENVAAPVFIVDGIKLTLDDITTLNS